MKYRTLTWFALLAPLTMGAQGRGCESAIFSQTEAPSMNGSWSIDYDNSLDVMITIGGSVYEKSIGVQGGAFTIEHEGRPLTFELDCARPEVICPSEVWPDQVTAEHRNEQFPHRFFVTIPKQRCMGALMVPEASQCGEGTNNPSCDQICEGEILTESQDAFGVVNEPGDGFELLLGAGAASNGINCLLLGLSRAEADLETSGSAKNDNWTADRMTNGQVIVGYAGGCLWADDVNGDDTLEAAVLGASIEFRTGFKGVRR